MKIKEKNGKKEEEELTKKKERERIETSKQIIEE